MQTFKSNGVIFNYNSDMSGAVTIKTINGSFDVNGEAILHFVANYIRNEKISKLYDMTTEELLEEII
jgi:hypothetical protein